jgi:sulfur-carrier protein
VSGSVRVLLFAAAREAAGRRELHRTVPPAGVSVADLLEELGRGYPKLTRVLAISRFFVNGSAVAGRSGRLQPGDELAIHPPYSGG